MSQEPVNRISPEKPGGPFRRGVSWPGEALLALLPTATVLIVLLLVDALSRQRLLFASLASSAFLIYLDPRHVTNTVRTLLIAQVGSACAGWLTFLAFGPDVLASASAMAASMVLMLLLDAVHPPAVSTSLSFALRAGNESDVALFTLAVGIAAVLVVLERATLWLLARYSRPGYNPQPFQAR